MNACVTAPDNLNTSFSIVASSLQICEKAYDYDIYVIRYLLAGGKDVAE
jgi:hypothetical protein